MRTFLVGLALVLAWPAHAGTQSDVVKQARAAFENAEFDKSVDLARRALAQPLSREEKIAALETMAFALVAEAKPGEAKAAFERLLRIDSNYQLPKFTSPKLRAALEEARTELNADLPFSEPAKERGATAPVFGPALLTVIPMLHPTAPRDGQPLEISVHPRDREVAKVVVFHRRKGSSNFSQLTAARLPVSSQPIAPFGATIPGDRVQVPAVEYYLSLFDKGGKQMGGAGSAEEPLLVDVLPRPARPVYTRGWFWGTVGGVVGAGAVAAILGATLGASSSNSAAVTVRLH